MTASINISNRLHSSLWILNKLQLFRLFLWKTNWSFYIIKYNIVVQKCSRLSFVSVSGFDFKAVGRLNQSADPFIYKF